MRVVSNSSPLLNLAIVDQLALTREQFGEVTIPSAVLRELRADDEPNHRRRVKRSLRGRLRLPVVAHVTGGQRLVLSLEKSHVSDERALLRLNPY